MKQRLIFWNFVLLVCAAAGGYQVRQQWMEARAQENAVLLRRPVPAKVNAPPPAVKPAPFQAVSYSDVAQKTLFSKDRNPNLAPPPPPPAPPPPPPMPALPHLYGVLGLPSGPVAIMSDKAGGTQQKVRQGENIGEFKIAKLSQQRITLTWNDKTVDKSVDDLLDRTPPPAPVAVAATTPGGNLGAPPPTADKAPAGMGIQIGDGVRACLDQNSETSAVGTVLEGYTKVKEKTPFGEACRWIQTK
jgi:hypothetical protein